MGREWYWGGRSSSSRRSSSFEEDDHGNKENPSLSAGCMNAVFQFFDFHSSHFSPHFIFNKQQQQHRHEQPSTNPTSSLLPLPKGVEAPRNSLELDGSSSLSYFRKESFGVPMGLKIKTSSNGRSGESEKEPENHRFSVESPGAKTPNLVARLMGLEILPETSSPSSQHHLSLQINLHKENTGVSDGIKQGKERMRKKVALNDITNTNRNLEIDEEETIFSRRRAENSSKKVKKMAEDSSTKRRFLEPITENLDTRLSTKCARELIAEKTNLKPKEKQKPRSFEENQKNRRRGEKEDAVFCSLSETKAIIDIEMDKSRKKTPLSNNLFPVKKSPSTPAAKIPHEQPCNYPKGKQKDPTRDPTREGEGERRRNTAIIAGGEAEFNYIKSILISNGISMDKPVFFPFPMRFSEITANSSEPILHRSNRKLLFDLVNELVAGILEKNPWDSSRIQGSELAEKLRDKIGQFPGANCQVLEDIDALIDTDFPKSKLQISSMAETQGIVQLVEFEIFDSLLRETAAIAHHVKRFQ